MEKIIKIEKYIVKEMLKQQFYFSQKKYDERCICIVKLTSSSGKYGWGEGYGPAHLLAAGVEFLKPLIQVPVQLLRKWGTLYF